MKAEDQVIGAALLVCIGVAIGQYIDTSYAVSMSGVILPAITSVAGTFWGARYAFSLQNEKLRRDEENKQVAALNAAIFALARKQNKLHNILTDVVNPWKNSPAQFLLMPPSLEIEKDDIQIDLQSLGYLFESSHVNLVGELTIAIAKYRSILDSINARSALHRLEVQPALEKAGIRKGALCSLADINVALGERLYETLSQATTQAVDGVPSTLQYITAVSKELSKVGKETFPHRKIMKTTLP